MKTILSQMNPVSLLTIYMPKIYLISQSRRVVVELFARLSIRCVSVNQTQN
jgi:hypothetical protein